MATDPYLDAARSLLAPTPAEPAQPDPYLETARQMATPSAAPSPLRGNLELAVQANPDTAARALKLGEEFQLSPASIEPELDMAERIFRLNELDKLNLERDYPKTAELLSDDLYYSRAVADSIEELVGAEKWVKGLQANISMSAERGYHMTEMGKLHFRQAFGDIGWLSAAPLTPKDQARLAQLKRASMQAIPLEDTTVGWIANSIAELGGQQGSQLVNAAPEMAAGAAVGATAAAGASLLTGGAAPLTIGAAAAKGAYAGYVANSIVDTFFSESGHAFAEIGSQRDLTGNLIDQDAARGAALFVGTVNAAIEFGGLALAAKTLGLDADSLARRFGGKGATAAIKDAMMHSPTVREAMKNYGKRIVKLATIESLFEEVPQELTNVFGALLAQKQDGSVFANTDWAEVADRVATVGAKTFVGSLALGGVNAAPRFAEEAMQARKAEQNQQLFKALAGQVEGGKLRERLPEALQRAYDHIAKGSPVERVQVKASKLLEMFQGNATDQATWAPLLEALPSVQEQLAPALASDGFVDISIGEFAAKIAGAELFQGIQDDVKFRPEEMTVNEAKDWDANYQDDFTREMELAARDAEEIAKSEAPADQVQTAVLQQLRQAGVADQVATQQAGLWRAFFATMGARAGIDPFDLLNRYQPRIESEINALATQGKVERLDFLLERLRKGTVSSEAERMGPSLLEYLSAQGGMRDENGELSVRGADTWHRQAPFKRRLVGEDGMDLASAAQLALDRGFISREENDTDGRASLLRAIERELAGESVRSPLNANEQLIRDEEELSALADYLSAQGIDPRAMSNQEVKDALAGIGQQPDAKPMPGTAAELFQAPVKRRKKVDDLKGRTFEEVAARIPDEDKIVSPDPLKPLDAATFKDIEDEPGLGLLALQDTDPARLKVMLEQMMDEAAKEAVLPDEKRARIVVPKIADIDKALRLSGRARYWYELSVEGFPKFLDFDPELMVMFIDVLAATSGGKEPKQNLLDALAVVSEQLRGQPVLVGQRDPMSITNALNPKPLVSHKFGNFAGTMQLLAGLREGAKPPLPTIDLQMANWFSMDQSLVSTDPVMYETLARWILKLRDLQNKYLEKGAQPYESWQVQALGWVEERGTSEPDDYAMHLPATVEKLREAGLPITDGKITRETLLHKDAAAVLAPTTKTLGEARTMTMETRTMLTPVGARSAEVFAALQGIDKPWARKARKEFTDIQRKLMRAIGNRKSVPVYDDDGNQVIVKGKKKTKKIPSLMSDLVSAVLGRKAEFTRVDTNGMGTFEGDASPNVRIPLTVGAGADYIVLGEDARLYLMAKLGKLLKQASMAASEFTSLEDESAAQTHSILVKHYDKKEIDQATLEALNKAIGFPLNYSKVPNGWLIDIVIDNPEGRQPSLDVIQSALDSVFEGAEIGVLPRGFKSDYLPESDYDARIQQYEESNQDDVAGGGEKSRDSRPDFGAVRAALEKIGEAVAEQERAFAEWADKYGPQAPVENTELFQSSADQYIDTPEFRAWFKQSAASHLDGAPVRLYHATTRDFGAFHDIDAFDTHQNVGNFLGAGHYTTDNAVDASENYTKGGADLTARLYEIKEKLADHWDAMDLDERMELLEAANKADDDAAGYGDSFIESLADDSYDIVGDRTSQRFLDLMMDVYAERVLDVQNLGVVMPLYVSIQNPFYYDDFKSLWGREQKATRISIERDDDYYQDIARQEVDEADYADDPEGYQDKLNEIADEAFFNDMRPQFRGNGSTIMDALDTLSMQIEQYDAGRDIIEEIRRELLSGEEIKAQDLVSKLRDATQYEYDSDGNVNGPDLIRQFIQNAGFDGVIMNAGRFGMQGTNGTRHVIAFDATQLKSVWNRGTYSPFTKEILKQETRSSKRGSIVLPKKAPGPVTINLFKKHDLSTFLHESGHFFLHVFHDLAVQPDAANDIVEDWQRIAKWLEVKPEQDGITVAQHEKFARGFEAYLFEGKAPSIELESFFARFRAWLVQVYKSIMNLDVELDDEVRGVMDRMLASEEQIAMARAALQHRPLFDSPEKMFATTDEYDRYVDQVRAAHDEAVATHQARLMQEYRRKRGQEYREAFNATAAEVSRELANSPVYRALNFLQKGVSPEGMQLTPLKLDKRALVELFAGSPDVLRRLPGRANQAVYTLKGGVHPDAAAELLGFSSGQELVLALVNAEPFDQAVQRVTEARLREQYGGMMRDGKAEDAALAAAHSDARGKALEMEARILSRQETTPNLPPLDSARRIAKETIARQKVRTATNPAAYVMAEQKAGRATERALVKGQIAEASRQKRQQLLNHWLAREAYKARDEIDAMLRYFKRLDGKAARGAIAPEYLEQIHGLLERFDLRKSVGPKQLAKRASLAAWIEKKRAQGFPVDIDDKLVQETRLIHYSQVSMETMRGLRDAVRNIEHLGRLKERLLKAKDQADFLETVDALENAALAHPDYRQEPLPFGGGMFAELAKAGRRFWADHLKPEFAWRYMDQENPQGVWWQTLFKPLADAEAVEGEKLRGVAQVWGRLLGSYTRRERALWRLNRQKFAGLGVSLTKEERLAIALNWGNEDSRQKLIDGYASHGWTAAGIQEVLDSLDKRDWDFVQGVWDLIDTFWPDIAELQRRLKGVAPERVEASVVQTKHGAYRGGYYPLKYDADLSSRALAHEEKQSVQEAFGGNWASAQTRQGHVKARKSGVKMPVRLSLRVATEHLENVIHDLAFRETVFDIDRLLQDDRIEGAIKGVLGTEFQRTLRPWLQGIASDRAPPSPNFLDRVMRRARHGMTVVAMGFSVGTGLAQITGYSQSVEVLGEKYALQGLGEFYGSPWDILKKVDFVKQRSAFMANRMDSLDRDVRDINKQMGARSMLDVIDKYAFGLIGFGDAMVSMPTWLGAYAKGMDQFFGDENQAIAYADSVVRMSQGSSAAKDLAAVQRGDELRKMFTMFYSYFAVAHNLMRRSGRNMRGLESAPRAALSFFYLVVIPAVLTELIVGRGPEDDDDWLRWATSRIATYPLMSLVLVRDVAQVATQLASGDQVYGYRFTPVADGFSLIADTLTQASQGDVDESLVRTTGNALGVWLKLPSKQAWKTGHYLAHYFDGDISDFSIYDALVTGYQHK